MNLSGYVYYVHKRVLNTSFQQHVHVVPQITQLPFSLSLLVALVLVTLALVALVLSRDPLPASDAGGGGEGAGGAGGGGVREGGEGGRKDLELPASLCSVDVVAI